MLQITKILKYQTQKAKKEYPTVFIIDHKTIFEGYHQYLPTFNSLSIESLLFKIPNLSEHFLYFCDDFFLANKIKVEDFFIEENPVIRGKWTKFYEDIFHKKIKYLFQKLLKNKKVDILVNNAGINGSKEVRIYKIRPYRSYACSAKEVYLCKIF